MNAIKKTIPYILLTAIIGAGVGAQELLKTNEQIIPITGTPSQTLIVDSPSETPTYAGCAFMWAYHDLPEESKKIEEAIKEIDPSATAFAQAYGEDCVYGDGTSSFGAMETDFYFIFETDLTNEDELGRLMIQSMKVLTAFPPGIVPGSQVGQATFTFKQGVQEINVFVDIKMYNELPLELSNKAVFQKFKTP